jgi:DNA-directed RNA polymerase II subunit RPB1
LVADDNADDLVIRIQVKDETAGNGKSSSGEDGEEEEDDACRDMVDNLKTLEKTILENVMIRGIPGIKGASMSKEETMVKKDGDYEKMNRWVIDTDGVNLYDVLVHPAVDTARTYCNQIHAMADIYGIEAARAIILNEIKEVFEFNDAYVNLRHIMLLVDVMTYRGILMSVDRHGINKTENGPLAKCSFEESTDVIAKSAIFGGMDPMLGVSANIMMGQEVPIGTGAVELVFDEENFRRWKQERRDELEEALVKRKDETVDTLDTMIVPSECTISSLMEDF